MTRRRSLRLWRGYLDTLDPEHLHLASRPSVLLSVLVLCGPPTVLLGHVDAASASIDRRGIWGQTALLVAGLLASWLLHHAAAPPAANLRRIGALNLLDTTLLSSWICTVALGASHPADCALATLSVAGAVIWGVTLPFSWPTMLTAAGWPAVLTAAFAADDLLHVAIVALSIPAFTLPALARQYALRAQRARDDTARKQIAEASRLATLGRVGAGVAHEMNQPLTVIRGFAQRLQRGGADGRQDELACIAAASDHLRRLVEQVQVLGSPRRSPIAATDPAAPVEDALLLMRRQLEFEGIQVRWRPPACRPAVLADRSRIGQVLVNLLANSRDALRTLATGAPRSVYITLEIEEAAVALVVTDDGPGVSAEEEPHLFEPFFTTKARPDGTGLGLAICREIAEEHGGELAFARPRSGGAQFRLRLHRTGSSQ